MKWNSPLGIAKDPQALIDHCYLWSSAGHLLFSQSPSQNPTGDAAQQTAHAYTRQGQLIASVRSTVPEVGMQAVSSTANDKANAAKEQHTWRYAYDNAQRRILSQETANQSELQAGTQKQQFQTNTAKQHNTDYDTAGMPIKTAHSSGERHFRWDAAGRLVSMEKLGKPLARYQYDHRGLRNSKTVYGQATSVRPEPAQGQTTHYLYSEDKQLLAEVDQSGKITRQYIYLADMPIAVIDSKDGKSIQHSLLKQEHLAHKTPGLEGDLASKSEQNASFEDSTTSIVWADLKTIAHIWMQALGADKAEHTAFIHTNHLGAPEAATDEQAQPIWQADYAPFGNIMKASLKAKSAPFNAKAGQSAQTSDGANLAFILNLRLPGQYEDQETGLHYNRQRYYDPSQGSYISPDPLGTPDGPNPYAYTAFNPLKYIDPDGLILFAFDGTGNTNNEADLAEVENGFSNVWNFHELYNDGPRRYVSGVGTRHRETNPAQFGGDISSLLGSIADMGSNSTGVDRIRRMEAYFNAEAELFEDNTKLMDVDIIGFSRGAAQAREFANRINSRTRNGQYSYTIKDAQGKDVQKCQMINFRFMGLWDTVLSTSVSTYDMRIVNGFQYVAHAVALNEYRGNSTRRLPGSRLGAFPLESAMGTPTPFGQSRIERGFIGAHADIGGGFRTENEIARVTLAWMIEQARDAGVKMNDSPSTISANPIIHDSSDNQYCLNGPGCSEDRRINDGTGSNNGRLGTQRNLMGTGMVHADTGRFISYFPPNINADGTQSRVPQADLSTGRVNMAAYLQWLRSNGYDLGNLQAR